MHKNDKKHGDIRRPIPYTLYRKYREGTILYTVNDNCRIGKDVKRQMSLVGVGLREIRRYIQHYFGKCIYSLVLR